MIIRILTEGQYELEGKKLEELDDLDDEMLDAIEEGNEQEFRQLFHRVLDLVRNGGRRLPDETLKESDLILPAPDITLEEAREMFAEYPRDLRSI